MKMNYGSGWVRPWFVRWAGFAVVLIAVLPAMMRAQDDSLVVKTSDGLGAGSGAEWRRRGVSGDSVCAAAGGRIALARAAAGQALERGARCSLV
jgi:hypothetical protein